MPAAHPLEPLTSDEISLACALTRGDARAREQARVVMATLREPPKHVIKSFRAGAPVTRAAEVLLLDRPSGLVQEAIVSLDDKRVVEWRDIDRVRPVLLFGESIEAVAAVQQHEGWQAAMRRRGIEDLALVQIDPWPAGNFALPGEDGRRLVRCVSYVRHAPDDNGYAHPVEGLVAVVDTATNEVVQLIDEETRPVPPTHGNYNADAVGPAREGLKPVSITQPEGVSFELDGNRLRWQRWDLRFSVHPIEGLVIHDVQYEDNGRLRSILHRASIAEMVVPYGATSTNHWWKNAFDVGEWGLGRMMQSLSLGCDCLGEITYADAVFADEDGNPQVLGNAVCIHEEDFGILWKHVDLWSGTDEVRRSRRLVVSAISTVGNYEYGFYWYFYLDGTIQLEVKLTGIMQTAALEDGEQPAHGVVVAPQLYAPHHQHLFCARLDFDVDGDDNSVFECDVVPTDAGPNNPYGNAMTAKATRLERESDGERVVDATTSRTWLVQSASSKNGLGQATGYRLVPGPVPCLLARPESAIAKRAAFATRNLWVTPYAPDERRPAGEYPNQHAGGAGLPEWTAADRAIADTDVVVWHTFGVTHVARPEDWPVMPVEYTGFLLKPAGFFDRNPALDVPAPEHAHCES